MAIAISLGAVILLYAAYGYGVDRSGNVYQNGLVFLASTPDAAQVKITSQSNQQTQTAITSDRLVLPADTYDFEFLKQGYKPWQRSIELKGGGIQRLVYPFLFPEKLVREDIKSYAEPGLSTVSPDRGTILVQRSKTSLQFDVFDANNPKKTPTSFALPSSLLSSTTGNLDLVEWSTDNRRILIKHVYGSRSEYVIIDRDEPDQSVNINQSFGLAPKRVVLRDKNANQLYIQQSDNSLYTAEVSERSKQQIVKNVLEFQPHGEDMLLYVSQPKGLAKNTVAVSIRTDNKSYELRELPKSSKYLLNLAQYNGNWLVAAGSSTDDRVYVYRNPVTIIRSNNPDANFSIRTMRINNPKHISFSANTQFIAVQSGQTFDVYDALDDRQYHYEIGTKFNSGSGPAVWMDGHRLLTITRGKLTVFDFDGSNYQTLTNINVSARPLFDRDYTSLYSLAPSVSNKDSQALVRTPLRVEEAN